MPGTRLGRVIKPLTLPLDLYVWGCLLVRPVVALLGGPTIRVAGWRPVMSIGLLMMALEMVYLSSVPIVPDLTVWCLDCLALLVLVFPTLRPVVMRRRLVIPTLMILIDMILVAILRVYPLIVMVRLEPT